MNFLWVFLGGGLGSVARYAIAWAMHGSASKLPYATLWANIISCFILGLLMALLVQSTQTQPTYKYFWMIGFCGGFSTFSTFTAENFQLIQTGNLGLAAINIATSILVCLVFLFAGFKAGEFFT